MYIYICLLNIFVYYSGDICETETDGCEDQPCDIFGATCMDRTPQDQMTTGFEYQCQSCGAGYTETDGPCIGTVWPNKYAWVGLAFFCCRYVISF